MPIQNVSALLFFGEIINLTGPMGLSFFIICALLEQSFPYYFLQVLNKSMLEYFIDINPSGGFSLAYIFIVEDEDAISGLIAMNLSLTGHTCITYKYICLETHG